ncbi:hypothetical protein IEQ34_012827 [Dendrobium chrysotoxum]|uniref:Uncharacterized protein n=1 Tax=Dendrobium chrysotoxum TaxID=161865 RepID=A0AAV7GMK2_DENCH|nr:hypothetical protein IEQ34_012827 [Dendrobium chrysotoxum]
MINGWLFKLHSINSFMALSQRVYQNMPFKSTKFEAIKVFLGLKIDPKVFEYFFNLLNFSYRLMIANNWQSSNDGSGSCVKHGAPRFSHLSMQARCRSSPFYARSDGQPKFEHVFRWFWSTRVVHGLWLGSMCSISQMRCVGRGFMAWFDWIFLRLIPLRFESVVDARAIEDLLMRLEKIFDGM